MEYRKIEELKVECIAKESDLSLFGITMDDLLERSEKGFHFLRKIKELAGINQKMEWTNIAYSLQMKVISESEIRIIFSETIQDYVDNLKQSLPLADESMQPLLKQFIDRLENEEEETARKMISQFEKNVRDVRLEK